MNTFSSSVQCPKFHNAHIPYLAIPTLEQKCTVPKRRNLGYDSGALWNCWDRCIVRTLILNDITEMQQWMSFLHQSNVPNSTMHISHISQYPHWNRNVLFQSGVIWDTIQVHYGIAEIGVLFVHWYKPAFIFRSFYRGIFYNRLLKILHNSTMLP